MSVYGVILEIYELIVKENSPHTIKIFALCRSFEPSLKADGDSQVSGVRHLSVRNGMYHC